LEQVDEVVVMYDRLHELNEHIWILDAMNQFPLHIVEDKFEDQLEQLLDL